MEMSQRNSLCHNLKQKKFFFLYFTKLENWNAEQVLPGVVVTVGRKVGGKGEGR
jgi:hypothetical protein